MALRVSRRHARRLSMTSLIDVIFLLLLFFMLSSTVSRFGTVDLMTTGQGQGVAADAPPLFLKVSAEQIMLNGDVVALDHLVQKALMQAPTAAATPAPLTGQNAAAETATGAGMSGVQVLLSLGPQVTAQRLVDVLTVLRQQPRFAVTVLG